MTAAQFEGISVQRNTPKDSMLSLANFAITRYQERYGRPPTCLQVGINCDAAELSPLNLPVYKTKLIQPGQVVAGREYKASE